MLGNVNSNLVLDINRMKIDLANAFEEQKRLQERFKQEEVAMEQKFKEKMLDKFREDEIGRAHV